MPDILRKSPIEQAIETLKNLTPIEREIYVSRQNAIRDEISRRDDAIRQGRQEVLVESIKRGLQLRFGEAGMELCRNVQWITNLDALRAILDALFTEQSIGHIRQLVNSARSEAGKL